MTDPGARRLGGRYEIGEVLGYGGMAEVHKGRDVRLGRDVAVKMLRADLARDPAFQSRFRREAQSAASLNHPSVVAVYDTGEDSASGGSSTPYIVMEYVDGRTLRDVLQTEGALLPQRALEIVSDILAALEYSHRAGIIHRDIKPGNVMLTRAGDVKVMDFGIARAMTGATSTMTQTAAVVGTAQYLSPEQARGEHVDQRSDIYSTGCLLYELLTGRPPFVGDSPVAVAYQHVREDAVPPSRLNPDVSPAIDAIVLKSMAKNPANRYQSAADMRNDVQRALAGRPVEATPVLADAPTTYIPAGSTTVLRRPPDDRRRQRTIAYTVLGLAVLGLFILTAWGAKHLFSGNGGGGIATPTVVGLPQDQAIAAIQAKGLTVGQPITQKYQGQDNCNQAKGIICDQNPVPGIALNKGEAVNLVVSLGAQQVQVPSVVDLSRNDATNALKTAKLVVGTITERDDPAPGGTVLAQTPPPGTTVDAGSKVDLVVASGNAPLPNVVGQTYSAAVTTLTQAGFKVSPSSVPDPNQLVTAQNPPGGGNRTAPRGSTITLTVTQPTPTPTPTPSPTATPPTTGPFPP